MLYVVGGLVVAVAVAVGARLALSRRDLRRIRSALVVEAKGELFRESMVEGLPEPGRRYLLHAIRPNTPLSSLVRLRSTGRMKPNPSVGLMSLTAREVIAARRGFLWQARLSVGPVSIHVTDHYLEEEGAVKVAALGLVPMGSEQGKDVARSSRHRLAAEHIWLPSALLPGPGVTWLAEDDDTARVVLDIDGDPIELTLHVAPDGAPRRLTMSRHGDVGRDGFGPIPYGFEVLAEGTFDGYTIPVQLRGGWWFGTDRYERADASTFEVEEAHFLPPASTRPTRPML